MVPVGRWDGYYWTSKTDITSIVLDQDPDSGVFWNRIRIRNPDPGALKKVKMLKGQSNEIFDLQFFS